MKRIIVIIIVLVIYGAGLVYKDSTIAAKSGEVRPTIGRIIKEKGIPVYTEAIKRQTFEQDIKISGYIKSSGIFKSEVTQDVINKIKRDNRISLRVNEESYSGKILNITKKPNLLSGLYTIVTKFENTPKAIVGKVSIANIAYKSVRNVITIPRAAVSLREKNPLVFKLDSEGKAKLTQVKIADGNDDDYMIRSGLKEGDEIIISDFRNLSDGDLVYVAKKVRK